MTLIAMPNTLIITPQLVTVCVTIGITYVHLIEYSSPLLKQSWSTSVYISPDADWS